LFDLRSVLRGSLQISLFFSGLIQIGVGSQLPTNFFWQIRSGKARRESHALEPGGCVGDRGSRPLVISVIEDRGPWRYRLIYVSDPIAAKTRQKNKIRRTIGGIVSAWDRSSRAIAECVCPWARHRPRPGSRRLHPSAAWIVARHRGPAQLLRIDS
jgi:hypothetical protein